MEWKKTKQTNYMKTLAFFLSDLINIGQCNSIKYCELGDIDPCGVVTFSFQKKTIPVPVRQSWVSLSPLLASLQNPSPRKTFHLIHNEFLVRKTLQNCTCLLLKNLNFSAVHRTYLTFSLPKVINM